MPITLVTGPANAGKAELVLDGVRAQLARGREPRLVVPTRADVEHYLRELAGADGAIGVRVEAFDGLIDELVRRAEVREPVLGELARERLLASIARGSAQDGRVGPGLIRALGELFAELQARRVGPGRLAAGLGAAFADPAAELGVDLAALYDAYTRALARIGRLDAEQRAMRALDRLRERPALWLATPVFVYGFDDLTPVQLDAIETLGAVVDAEVTVALSYEPGRVAFAGRAATFHALEPIAREHRVLPPRSEHYAPARATLSHLERSLFEPDARQVVPADAVRLLRGEDQRSELELIATQIRALLDGGVAAHDIVVVVRRGERAAELVREVFAAAGIPFALRRKRPLFDTSLGRALIGLLRCVAQPDGGERGEIADLLAWLRAPGVLRHPGLADALEVRARRTGVRAASQARALWEERNWPLEAIDRLARAQARGPGALLERAGRELDRLFSAPRRGQASVLAAAELDDAGALVAARRALSELRELVRLAPEAAPGTAAELAAILAGVELRGGEQPGAGTVAVLDPLALRARRVQALFVCGLQEGEFPSRERPQPLLAEPQRVRLAEASGLLLRANEDVLAADRYLLYALLSRPQERLLLSWHEADDAGEPISRSLFVDDVCDLFSSDPPVLEAPAATVAPAERARADAGAAAPLGEQVLLDGLRRRMWSASSLERWIACPVRWFVERLLEPGAFEPDPEPLARGGLAHAALNDTLVGLRAETGSARLTSASLPRALELLERALAGNEHEHPLSVSPERRATVRRGLHCDLMRYLEHAAAADSGLEPRELELGFGFTGEDELGEPSELPAFDLGDGVLLRGRIDRIDVAADGEAVVLDYKSRSAPPVARWLRDGRLQVALYMRAAEQLLELPVVGGLYQPLGGADLQARGVLSDAAQLDLDVKRNDLRDPGDVRDLLDAAVAAARAAAGEAARGELEPRPTTCDFGRGCAYPTICRCER